MALVHTFDWGTITSGGLFLFLQYPDTLIMLLSAIKPSQILIAVVIGGLLFKEQNKRKKLEPLAGINDQYFFILYS